HAAVAATEGILQNLNDEELEGVIGHELSHVKHRDILISSVAATLAAAVMMLARFAMFFGGSRDDRERSNPIALVATIILAPLAARGSAARPTPLSGVHLAASGRQDGGGSARRRPGYLTKQDWRNRAADCRPRD